MGACASVPKAMREDIPAPEPAKEETAAAPTTEVAEVPAQEEENKVEEAPVVEDVKPVVEEKAEAPAEPSPSTTEKAEEPKEASPSTTEKAEEPKEVSPSTTEKAEEPKAAEATEAAVPEIKPIEEAAPKKEAEAEEKIQEIKADH